MTTLQSLTTYGQSLIGKTAQSSLLTEISESGRKIISAPNTITSFEIVSNFMEPTLMVTIGGQSVYEDTCFNIK